jgi:phosphoenolpyruvate synthase/pyruvate phosphate dikinase
LIGKPVYLVIKQDTFTISLTSEEKVKKYIAQQKKKSKKPIELRRNILVDTLISAENLSYSSVNFAGGKASNMGELMNINSLNKKEKLNLPYKPFAIPLFFYVQHLQTNKIDFLISNLLKDSITMANDSLLRIELKKIRKAITKSKIDSSFLAKLTTYLKQNYIAKSFRFRSSTNAEDIDGFNGAGLYDSKTGILNDSIKSIEHAIKQVWASTWSERAFKERRYFNLNQNNVAMAILVHPAFGDENINAVAITKNLYRSDYPAYIVNLQKGETPVVGSPDSVNYEQIILYDKSTDESSNKIVVEFLSYSSLNDNKPLLSNKEYEDLYNTLLEIKKHYYFKVPQIRTDSYYNFALDIELKWIGVENKLFVKQARVYNH